MIPMPLSTTFALIIVKEFADRISAAEPSSTNAAQSRAAKSLQSSTEYQPPHQLIFVILNMNQVCHNP
jgi:hypothetical protein